MGMGDKKPTTQHYTTRRCYVCDHEMTSGAVRECPHPAVMRKYGRTDGVAPICVYCCRKCKHAVWVDFTSALGCNYEVAANA